MQGDQNEIRIVISADNRRALRAISEIIAETQRASAAARQAGSNPIVGPTGQPLATTAQQMGAVATQAPTTARAATALATSLDRVATSGERANLVLSQVAATAQSSIGAIDAETTALRQLGAALTAIATNRRALTALGTIGTATGAPGGSGGASGPVGGYPGGALGPAGGVVRPIATPSPLIPAGGAGGTPVNPAAIQAATNASNGLNLSLGSILLRVAQFKLINEVFNGITGAISYASSESVKFQTNMMRIVALTNESKSTVTAWSVEVRKMALEGPSSANELAQALYTVASSGIAGSKAMGVLEAANLGARAGMGDVQDIAKTLTGTMNAYGEAVGSPVRVMDMFTQAAKEGSAEAADYALHLGAVIPLAAQAGISLQHLLAFVATGTRVGLPTTQVVTGARALIENLLAPRKESEEARVNLGLTRDDVRQGMQGDFTKFIVDLNKRAAERGPAAVESLDKMIPNIRALTTLLAAVGPNGGDSYIQVLDSIIASQNVTARSGDAFAGSVERSGKRVQAAWAELGMQLGSTVNPALAEFLELMARALGAPQKIPAPVIGEGGVTGYVDREGAQGAPIQSYGVVIPENRKAKTESPEDRAARQAATMAEDIAKARTETLWGKGGIAETLGFNTAEAIEQDLLQAAQAARTHGPEVPAALAEGIASGAPEVEAATTNIGRLVSDAMGEAAVNANLDSTAEKMLHTFDLAIMDHLPETIVAVTAWAAGVKEAWRRELALEPTEYERRASELDNIIMGGITSGDRTAVDRLSGLIGGSNKAKNDKYIADQQEAARKKAERDAEQAAREAERRTHTAARGFTEAWEDETQRREFQTTMGAGGAQAAQRFVDAFANAADFERGAEEKGKAVVASIKTLTDEAKALGIPAWKELGDLVGSAMLSAIEAQIAGSDTADQLKQLAIDALAGFAGEIEARKKFNVGNVLGSQDFQRVLEAQQAGGGPALGLFNAIDDGLRNGGLASQRTAQQSIAGILGELAKLDDRHLAVEIGRQVMALVAEGIEDGTPEGLEAMRRGVGQVLNEARLAQAQIDRDQSIRKAQRNKDEATSQLEGEYARRQAERRETMAETQRQQREQTRLQREFEDQRQATTYGRETEGIQRQQDFEDEERTIQRRESRQMATVMRQVQFQTSLRATQRQYDREDAARKRSEGFEETEMRLTGRTLSPEEKAARDRRRSFDATERRITREEARKESELQQSEQVSNERTQQALQEKLQDEQLGRQRQFAATERDIREQQRQADLIEQRTFEDDMTQLRIDNEEKLYGISQYYEGLRLTDQRGRIQQAYDEELIKARDTYEKIRSEADFYNQVTNPDMPNPVDPRRAFIEGGVGGLIENYIKPMQQRNQAQDDNQAEPGSIEDIINKSRQTGGINLTIQANNNVILTEAEQAAYLAGLQSAGLEILATGLALSGGR